MTTMMIMMIIVMMTTTTLMVDDNDNDDGLFTRPSISSIRSGLHPELHRAFPTK